MNTLIERLKHFNAKERYFLLRQVLGKNNFRLDQKLRSDLEKALGIEIPQDAPLFAAMDYHLDWIYAALQDPQDNEPQPNPDMGKESGGKLIRASQEDIDFLIAFEKDDVTHIVLLEAKAYTGWSQKQIDDKTLRLRNIFSEDVLMSGVRAYLVLMSPSEPERLKPDGCPSWMLRDEAFIWIPLEIDPCKKVTRCDEAGNANQDGGLWIVENRKEKTKRRKS